MKDKNNLTLFFVMTNFTINLLTLALLWIIGTVLIKSGIIPFNAHSTGAKIFAVAVLSVSYLISCTVVAMIICHWTLKPINKTIDAMNELSKGNFSKRIYMNKSKAGFAVSNSFNRLAEELENTEMLRSDFVNNFSHEFKTPIVSILGFSRLLKKGVCTPEEQQEYLNIIEEESLRLSQMATNVLNITKIENQTILTDVTTFNLSEQIRNCLLLLEKQWSQKNHELNINFDEYEISANEELLKQVWINLIDNAVKFTPEYGEINIDIHKNNGYIIVQIQNTGEKIPDKDIERVFSKFYQADTSHSSSGTGLGLSIVKKIVELHGGNVHINSDEYYTKFTVELPQ